MMQKPVFKVFIWFISTAFFFLATALLVSALGPEPSEQQIMQFMSGMMGAMQNSMMGLSMSLEQNGELKTFIGTASNVTVPLMLLGFLFGLLIRLRRKKDAR
ncbi:MAG: hypothetical protein K0R31_603 [Clostridiales bacterium]|jgi:lipopolysaccharide export LptBFGC system permease protein LptF|nr:hypothetical protein [Clostridiales bacterium]